jgi:hypothetical protein
LFAQSPDFLWATGAGGINSVDPNISIAVDVLGNSYGTGVFKISGITFGSTTLKNSGGNVMFVAKIGVSVNSKK